MSKSIAVHAYKLLFEAARLRLAPCKESLYDKIAIISSVHFNYFIDFLIFQMIKKCWQNLTYGIQILQLSNFGRYFIIIKSFQRGKSMKAFINVQFPEAHKNSASVLQAILLSHIPFLFILMICLRTYPIFRQHLCR